MFPQRDAFNTLVNPELARMVEQGGLWMAQFKAVLVTLVLALVGSTVLAFAVKALVGLRPTDEVERQGLDIVEHGEEGYPAASGAGARRATVSRAARRVSRRTARPRPET